MPRFPCKSGDDFKIVGLDHMNATIEFTVREGKIYSILSKPDSEDWAKFIELTSGGIGIEIKLLEQGVRVEGFTPGSLAYEAGLRIGDVIIAVD